MGAAVFPSCCCGPSARLCWCRRPRQRCPLEAAVSGDATGAFWEALRRPRVVQRH